MYFGLKLLHVAAMTAWFSGLFFLPRLLLARSRTSEPDAHEERLGRALYFGVMTPGAVLTIVLGTVLLGYGFEGAWLPAKLTLVAAAVLLHVYLGQLLLDRRHAQSPATPLYYRALNWVPLVLLLGIAGLTAGKPASLALPLLP